MKQIDDRPARGRIPRSRGAVIGLLLVLLGAWGALIPFVGPNFEFAYTPGQAWTAARGWLEVLPGAVTAFGGVLLIISRSRGSAMLGGWLAALGGVWFIVGTAFAPVLGIGSAGDPVAATDRKRAVLEVAYFSGLGALITFLAGAAVARLAVRLARDVQREEAYREEAFEAAPAAPAYADQPVMPAHTPTAAHDPYRPPFEQHPAEPPSQALTAPRGQQLAPSEGEPQRGGIFRRHRTPVTHPQ